MTLTDPLNRAMAIFSTARRIVMLSEKIAVVDLLTV
jgi:hypothetical protein